MSFKFYKFNCFKHLLILIFGFSTLGLTGCAPKLGGDDYEVSGVGTINTTLKGVIVSKRIVMLRPDNHHDPKDHHGPKVGTAAGAVGGAALGSLVGGGHKVPLLSGVIGGIAGGAAGHAIEQKLTEQKGFEYHIKLSNGDLITIAQGIEPNLPVGQKVLLIKSEKGRSRVIADNH